MDRVSIDKRICKSPRARPEIGILYFLHVVPRFAERRNPLCLVNRPFTRIVRRQSQIQVAIVALQQHLQMSNPGVDILFRVKQVVRSVSLRRRRDQLHQSAGAFVRIRPRVPVRFRFDHRANQCRVHAMPFRSFSYEFFCSVSVNAHGRVVASRKRRFARQVDGCARPYSAKLQRRRRFGIHEKLPPCRFRNLGDLGAGSWCEKTRAKNQRSQMKPCRDCRAFHHCASGKANTIFATRYRVYSFRHRPVGVNVSSVLGAPTKRSTPGGERLASGSSCEAVLAGRSARLEPHWARPGQGRARKCSRPDGFWRYCGPARAARIPL